MRIDITICDYPPKARIGDYSPTKGQYDLLLNLSGSGSIGCSISERHIMMCEKCWGDAYLRMLINGRGQAENYGELLQERQNNPCTPEEQKGQHDNARKD